MELTLPIRNLIYNVNLEAYLPYVVNRDREAFQQGHLEEQTDYADLNLTSVWASSTGFFKLEA